MKKLRQSMQLHWEVTVQINASGRNVNVILSGLVVEHSLESEITSFCEPNDRLK